MHEREALTIKLTLVNGVALTQSFFIWFALPLSHWLLILRGVSYEQIVVVCVYHDNLKMADESGLI